MNAANFYHNQGAAAVNRLEQLAQLPPLPTNPAVPRSLPRGPVAAFDRENVIKKAYAYKRRARRMRVKKSRRG